MIQILRYFTFLFFVFYSLACQTVDGDIGGKDVSKEQAIAIAKDYLFKNDLTQYNVNRLRILNKKDYWKVLIPDESFKPFYVALRILVDKESGVILEAVVQKGKD